MADGTSFGPSGEHGEGTRCSSCMTVIATWNDTEIARSDRTVVVEGNHYFPMDDVRADVLAASDTTTVCPWKGTASYFTITLDGAENPDAAWTYPTPKDAAVEIAGRVAFWRGVRVETI